MKIQMRTSFAEHWKRRHNPMFREYVWAAIEYEKLLRKKKNENLSR